MRVLHIIPSLQKGGAERLVIDIVAFLNQIENVDARIALLHNDIEYDIRHIIDKIDIIPSTIHLSVWKKNRLLVKDLQAYLEQFKPDIIHSHLFEAEIVSRSCMYTKAKWFTHCHDNMKVFETPNCSSLFDKTKLSQLYEKKYLLSRYRLNMSNVFIAISENTKEYFVQNTTGYKVEMLPNAIEYDKYYAPIVEKTALNLIAVGRLDENKNYSFLIDVANTLKKKEVPFSLKIIGDGVQKNELQSKINQLGLAEYVHLLGKRSDVPFLLQKSSIFLHSAKSEAFGLTLIEAMAAGLPVITLDGGGNRDLIKEGQNGYLVRTNSEAFAQQIVNLWNNKNLYKHIALFAQGFSKNFDIKTYIQQLLAIYES